MSIRNNFLATSFIFLAIPVSGFSQVLEPVKETCATKVPGIEVRIVGNNADLIEIHDRTSGKFYPAYDELRAEMGGRQGIGSWHAPMSFRQEV